MKSKLTNILSSVTKKDCEVNLVVLFKDMIKVFKSDNSNFTQVVESAFVNFPTLRSSSSTDNVEFFKEKGVLLFDGMHAAAGGHMSYIYRAKGMRLYLFENGDVGLFSVYCTINEDGFQYTLEEGYGIESSENITIEDVNSYLSMLDNLEFRDFSQVSKVLKLLYLLTHVKHNYDIAYYLEYVLYPPDVDVLSFFSNSQRETIWDICLSESFEDVHGVEEQQKVITELSRIGISPSPFHLTNYLKRQFDDKKLNTKFDEMAELFKSRFDSIGNKIDNVANDVDNVLDEVKDIEMENKIRHEELLKEDIIDIKPNIYGIGINGNEIFRRLRKKK